MNQNKIPTNKQIVKALKQTLLQLHNGVTSKGKSRYICFAVHTTRAPLFVKDYISGKIIMARLEGQASLNGWLISKGVHITQYAEPKRLMQQHRIAWVQKLIKEFSDGH